MRSSVFGKIIPARRFFLVLGFLFVVVSSCPCAGYTSFFGKNSEYASMQQYRAKKYAPRRVRVMRDFFKSQNPSISHAAARVYAALTERICRKYKVDPFLVAAIIAKESTVRVKAKSGVAYGLMQVNWKAHKDWIPQVFPTIKSRRDLLHSRPNIYVGTCILRRALDAAGGRVDAALDAYRGRGVTAYRRKIYSFYKAMARDFREP